MAKLNDPIYLEIKDNAIKLYEKNVPCIAQIKRGFIKDDRTNHIFLKLFGTHKL